MTPTEWQEEACFIHDPADDELFAKWTAGLPERKETTPYHSQAHCIRPMSMAFKMVRPTSILEIGFCLGHSASIWFGLGASTVVCLENSARPETLIAAQLMSNRFGVRFNFVRRYESEIRPLHYDLAYIDGDHSKEGVEADIDLCRSLGIRWALFDDVLERWGPGVMPAITAKRVVPVAIFGNMALCDLNL